jgi:hypothetical protein
MERVSGWYKQKTQALVFALAVMFAVTLNVDTIQLIKRLSYDSALRQSIVAQAEKLAEQPPAYIVVPRPVAPSQPAEGAASQPPAQQPAQTTPAVMADTGQAAAQLQTQIAALSQTGIPLGWDGGGRPSNQNFWVWWLTKFFGLLLTASAASLGAPFWFDILNKIVTIRSAGKAPEEQPKQPKELPRPVAPGQSPSGNAPATMPSKPESTGGGMSTSGT